MRKVRGDGNCFFRGFAFAYMEQLLNNKEDFNRYFLMLLQAILLFFLFFSFVRLVDSFILKASEIQLTFKIVKL